MPFLQHAGLQPYQLRFGWVAVDNLVYNHGAVMPASWAGQWIGSDGLAVPNTTTPPLDLAAGPVLSA